MFGVNIIRKSAITLGVIIAGLTLGACSSKPPIAQTGFLSTYDNLRAESDSRLVYGSTDLADYTSFIIDPIEMRVPLSKLSAADQAEAARYFRASTAETIRSQGFTVTDTPGLRTARVQIAMTDIAKSTWWRKIHPVWRSLGAGTGGAAMEAEIVDSVSGRQLAAVVQSVSGNQFDFTAFSTLSDVKSAIDKWGDRGRLELRQLSSPQPAATNAAP